MSSVFLFRRLCHVPAAAALLLLHLPEARGWTNPSPIDLNTTTTVRFDTHLALAAGGGGSWGAAWTSNSSVGSEFGVLFSRSSDLGATWSPPVDVSRTVGFPEGDFGDQPCLATDGGNTWILSWDSCDTVGDTIQSDRDIFFVRSTDGGSNWSAPDHLNSNFDDPAVHNSAPAMAYGGNGNWLAVWEAMIGAAYTPVLAARSTDGGQNWSEPVVLDPQTSAAINSRPCVVTDGSGTWLAAWESTGTTDSDVLVARSTNNGQTWSPAVYLNSHFPEDDLGMYFYDGQVRLATDRSGTWVAVWTSSYDANGTVPVSDRILFSRSTDNGQTWSVAAPVVPVQAADGLARQVPDLIWDGNAFVVVWTGLAGLESAVSTDGGQSWTGPSSIAGNSPWPGGAESRPRLAAGAGGTRMAAWISRAAEAEGPDFVSSVDNEPAAAADWSLYD